MPPCVRTNDTAASLRELRLQWTTIANQRSLPIDPFIAELRLQGPLRDMRTICGRRLNRDRPGFGKPCNLCFGPFSSLGRVGFLEADANTAGDVHTMRASLSWSELLR